MRTIKVLLCNPKLAAEVRRRIANGLIELSVEYLENDSPGATSVIFEYINSEDWQIGVESISKIDQSGLVMAAKYHIFVVVAGEIDGSAHAGNFKSGARDLMEANLGYTGITNAISLVPHIMFLHI